MNHKYLNYSDAFAERIVKCINNAVCKDIVEDFKRAGLLRENSNSYPSRSWDVINKNLFDEFSDSLVIAKYSKRGPWNMLPVFDCNMGTIYSIMREERFVALFKKPQKNVHYIQALANAFNINLISNQQTLYPMDLNQNEVLNIIEKICSDLRIPQEIVKKHAIILFSSKNDNLISIRCCVITSSFQICEEVDWTQHITANESTIVDEISNLDSKYNDPTQGLSYTQRAKKKKNFDDNATIINTDTKIIFKNK